MILRLPIKQDGAHFVFATELDGVSYSFEFRWNDRDEAWFLTFGDGEGDPIVNGVKVVINVPLLNSYRDPQGRMPTGSLIAIDTAGTNQEAGYADLGTRVILNYIPADEDLG